MKAYQYRPVVYFAATYICTWTFWLAASACGENALETAPGGLLMIAGLMMPGLVGLAMMLTSGDAGLKAAYRKSVLSVRTINWRNLAPACLLYLAGVVASILLSTAFGQSLDQFAWAPEFSFADGGVMALATLVIAAILEEWGWRGYGEDSLANGHTWFTASVAFGVLWSLWHAPLFLVGGTYQNGLLDMGPMYVMNFFVSAFPLTFILTWVYVRSNRSMMACVILHFFVNFCQEKIALTPETKCIETIVMFALAAAVVLANRELFFGRSHFGTLARKPEAPLAKRNGRRIESYRSSTALR